MASDRLRALIDDRIADALASEGAGVCTSLLSVAELFAQLDQRLAAMEAKLDRPLDESPPLDPPSRTERPH